MWAKWETDVVDFKQDWYILCWAAKQLDGRMRTCSLPDSPNYKKDLENDEYVVRQLWRLFDEADILIAHNGDQFDVKKANARFAFYNLPPPSPYKTIDTKKVAKHYFNFTSNKLDDLGNFLGYGRKLVHTGFELWRGCMRGDPKSWKTMLAYNKRDVILLEQIYKHFLPWITNHPNTAVLSAVEGCPNCASTDLQRRGYGLTKTGTYQRFQCKQCGAWSHGPSKKLTNITN